MRIVLVGDHAHASGGQARVMIDGALSLHALGHEVVVFAGAGPVAPELTAAGMRVECLDQPDLAGDPDPLRAARRGIWNGVAERRLAALLAEMAGPETLVHLHGWAKCLSPSIGRALARSGVPCVTTLHEYFLACPAGSFLDYPAGAICRRRPMSMACVTRNCDTRSYAHKAWRVARQAVLHGPGRLPGQLRHVVHLSELQRAVMRPLLPDHVVWHRVSNPISTPHTPPKTRPGAHFLFVGRLSPEKGVALFAEAAEMLGVRALVVGDGPARDEIAATCPNVELLGWRSPQEVAALMREARALVFPSLWYEGQPLTVYEALAQGTPVIVSDACAGREAVADGETGLWMRSGDADHLAARMARLMDDAEAARMGQETHARYWADPLTLERHCARLVEVYETVLSDGAPGRAIA